MTGESKASRVATLIMVTALGTAACGNRSDATGTSTDAGPESSASTSAAPSRESGSPDTSPAVVGDFCQLNDELAGLFGELALRSGAYAEATWLDIEIVVERLQEASPPKLVDDVAAGAQYYGTLGEALEAGDFDDPVGIVESMPQDAEMDQVESRVDDYLDADC
jgi:hypothetical protein